MTPELASVLGVVIEGAGVLLVFAAGVVSAWFLRRSEREKAKVTTTVEQGKVVVEQERIDVEERRVELDGWKALTAQQSVDLAAARSELGQAMRLMTEARLDHLSAEAYAALLTAHIESGNPPPPPARPTPAHRKN